MTGFLRATGVALFLLVTSGDAVHATDPFRRLETGSDKDDVGRAIDITDTDDSGFVLLPFPIFDPTIGNGMAVVALHHYRLDAADKVSPPSSTLIAAGHTDTDSSYVGGFQKLFLKEDRYRFDAFFAVADLNLKFFGIGSGDLLDVSTEYNIDGFIVQPKVLARVAPNLYVGGVYSYFGGDVTFKDTGIPGVPTVGLDSSTAGLGPLISFDTRDNTFSAARGSYSEAAKASPSSTARTPISPSSKR